jgi:hypothetical protein
MAQWAYARSTLVDAAAPEQAMNYAPLEAIHLEASKADFPE